MEFFRTMSTVCTIETGQIMIPAEMYNQLCWQQGDRLEIISNKKFRFLELIKHENGRLNVDSNGRIAVPDDCLCEMQWGEGQQIVVRLNSEAASVTLMLCRR